MAFPDPYVTDKFTAYKVDVLKSRLTMAVWLTDDYTGKAPVGCIKVTIKEGNIEAARNLSGYYIFTGQPSGNYTVRVHSDLYFTKEPFIKEPTVDTSLLDPKNPVVNIILKPRPAYPFPENATLVRGLVSSTGPVVNANVKVVGLDKETVTDENGEFVLYFNEPDNEIITIEIKKNTDSKLIEVTLNEWKTKSMGKIAFP